jgi:hypothetical protein
MGLFIACCVGPLPSGVNYTDETVDNSNGAMGGGGLNPGCSGSLSFRQDVGDDPGPPILKHNSVDCSAPPTEAPAALPSSNR